MSQHDLTDTPYWERFWTQAPMRIVPSRGSVKDFVREQALELLTDHVHSGERWVEIGCAGSRFLLDFPLRLNATLDGVDIVESALHQTQAELQKHGLQPSLRLHDYREPTLEEEQAYDGLISWGFVEHFADCVTVHQELSKYLRPGGTLISVVPNMTGLPGLLQQWTDLETFLSHNALTTQILADACTAAGLEVLSSEPIVSLNLGVINPANRSRLARRLIQTPFVGLSRASAVLDNARKVRPRRKLWAAPYLMLVARKPTA